MQKTFLDDKELAKYIGFQREHLWLVQERLHEAQVRICAYTYNSGGASFY